MLLTSLLGTPFLFGGFLTCFFDLTFPGKKPKKGLEVGICQPKAEVCSIEESENEEAKPHADDVMSVSGHKIDITCYDLPYITRFTNRLWFVRYIPILSPPPKKGKDILETPRLNSARIGGLCPDTETEVSIPLVDTSLFTNNV